MNRFILIIHLLLLTAIGFTQPKTEHNLHFYHLAQRWDEAIPLGNGMMGALIWQKDSNLRISLDRADLWDERKAFAIEKHDFQWVQQQLKADNYAAVQEWGDTPYDASPYPTKLPAAALTFNLAKLGRISSNVLDIATAIHTLTFDNGTVFTSYIHAVDPIGYFEIDNIQGEIPLPKLLAHPY